MARAHVEAVFLGLDDVFGNVQIAERAQGGFNESGGTADVVAGVGLVLGTDGPVDVAVKDFHQPDEPFGMESTERGPIHGALRIQVGEDDRRNLTGLHQRVEQAADRGDATAGRHENVVGPVFDQGKLSEGTRQARRNRVVQGLKQVGDAARPRSLHAEQDAPAMAGDDGKGAAAGAAVQLDLEHHELTRLEMEGSVAGQDGHFHRFRRQAMSGLDGDVFPHDIRSLIRKRPTSDDEGQ